VDSTVSLPTTWKSVKMANTKSLDMSPVKTQQVLEFSKIMIVGMKEATSKALSVT